MLYIAISSAFYLVKWSFFTMPLIYVEIKNNEIKITQYWFSCRQRHWRERVSNSLYEVHSNLFAFGNSEIIILEICESWNNKMVHYATSSDLIISLMKINSKIYDSATNCTISRHCFWSRIMLLTNRFFKVVIKPFFYL
jgi:hypothetical protein